MKSKKLLISVIGTLLLTGCTIGNLINPSQSSSSSKTNSNVTNSTSSKTSTSSSSKTNSNITNSTSSKTSTSTSSNVLIESTSSKVNLVEYLITIKTIGNVRVNDVKVDIYDGEKLVGSYVTDYLGNIEVKLEAKPLKVKLSNLQKGMYEKEEGYKLDGKGGEVLFKVMSKVIEENTPTKQKYKLGEIMYDFNFTDTDGNTYSLADTLKTKELVLINFWASWCGPCQMEFPNFELGYGYFSDKIEYFVMSVEPTDTNSYIEEYKDEMGLSFPMGRDEDNLYSRFGYNSIPLTVLVNKYGIISYIEVGAITSEDKFIGLLEDTLRDLKKGV